MIFHYFGTKKALYLYLIDLCGNILMDEMDEKFDYTVTDFFDRIKLSSDIEISVMKMLTWLTDGYVRQLSIKAELDYDVVFKELDECLDLLKNNFYKEEYLP